MAKGTTTTTNSNKLIQYIKAPVRVLSMARDFYVNNLMGCARSSARMSSAMPRSRSHAFPRSAATSSDQDIRDLIRAASRATRPKNDVVPRSQSVAVGIGRIDEDRPCTFVDDDDDFNVGAGSVYPRSKSCAVVDQRRVRILDS